MPTKRNRWIALCILITCCPGASGQQISKQESELVDLMLDKTKRSATPSSAQKPQAPIAQRPVAPGAAQRRPLQVKQSGVSTPPSQSAGKVDLSKKTQPSQQSITLDSRGAVPSPQEQAPKPPQVSSQDLPDAYQKLLKEAESRLKAAEAKNSDLQQKLKDAASQSKRDPVSDGRGKVPIAVGEAQKLKKDPPKSASANFWSKPQATEVKGADRKAVPQPVETKKSNVELLKVMEARMKADKVKSASQNREMFDASRKKVQQPEAKSMPQALIDAYNKLQTKNLNPFGEAYAPMQKKQQLPFDTGSYQSRLRRMYENQDAMNLKAAEDRRHKKAAKTMLDAFDMDTDGLLDLDEIVEGGGREHGLMEADEDGDMQLTAGELASLLGRVDRSVANGGKHRMAEPTKYLSIAASVMQNLDTDMDGKVSIAEVLDVLDDGIHDSPTYRGWHKGFKEADINQDMQLNVGELAHLFEKFDETEL